MSGQTPNPDIAQLLAAYGTDAEQQWFRSITDAVGDALIVIDQQGFVVDWNPQAEAIFGWRQDEAIGRSLAEMIVPPVYRDAHTRGLQRFLAEGEGPILGRRIEITGMRRDATEFPVELTILRPVRFQDQYFFSALVRDISARKQAEEAVRQSESLYHSLVDALPIHVTRKDVDGRITYVNSTFCRLLGLSEDEILGKTDFDFFPSELADKYRQDDQRVLKTGEPFACIEENRTAGGTRYFEVRKTPVYDAEGNAVESQAIFWDVTEREESEEQLRRYATELERSNRDLDEFVAVVSHDLHAPLRAVAGYCQLLQRRYQSRLDEDAKQFIEYATEGASRMQQLIENLQGYARITHKPASLKMVDAEKSMGEALANLETVLREKGAMVTHDPLPAVMADATQLMQLFQNLIGNAIKYCRDRSPEVHVRAAEEDQEWCFSVRDNGIGIDPKHAKDIFRIFQRLHEDQAEYGGTGIGLATCKRIVERHGGRIWVESEPGQGSTFCFTIPR